MIHAGAEYDPNLAGDERYGDGLPDDEYGRFGCVCILRSSCHSFSTLG